MSMKFISVANITLDYLNHLLRDLNDYNIRFCILTSYNEDRSLDILSVQITSLEY